MGPPRPGKSRAKPHHLEGSDIKRMLEAIKRALGLTSENRILWATSLGHAYTHWFPSVFYLLLPLIREQLGLSYTEMGLLVSVRMWMSTIANFPSGMVVDMVGRKNLVMGLALAWVGIPYLFIGISQSYAALLACMAIIGAGNHLWHPSAMSVLHDTYPQKRGWAIGFHASAANIGDALGPVVTGALLVWITWRQVLVSSALPGIFMALLIYWLLSGARPAPAMGEQAVTGQQAKGGGKAKPKPATVKEYLLGLGRLVTNRNVLLLALTSGVRSFTQNGMSTFLPSYFMNTLMLSPALSGIYMGIIQVAGVIAAPISGRISDARGRRGVVTQGMVLTSVAIILLALANIPWLLVVFLGVVGFFLYSLRPVLFAWTMELAPQEYTGGTVGLLFTAQSGLSSLAPIVGGWVADNWGLMYTFYVMAATILLANLLVFLVPETRKGREQETIARAAKV